MSRHHSFIDTVDLVISDAVRRGIIHLNTQDQSLSGNTIQLNGRNVLNFGSCSYLGLEFDERMKAASIRAIEDYGTQFSSSRAYVSAKYYEILEGKFNQIFSAHTVVAPTTTLGHIGIIPVLVNNDDAIILDHQVHNSVQIAVNLVKPKGTCVELIRHNRMDLLEDRIKVLRQKYKRIWYMADGIYSMFGDFTLVEDVYALMDKYPEVNYYIDDAHGMSCFGKHGSGYALSRQPIHDRMILTTSLAKAFPTGGAVLVFPNAELARKVRTCGASLVTSGPMQPAALGAAIACADIHLSDEIYIMQEELQENIKYCNLLLKKYGLPCVAETNSPVFFIAVSLPKLGYNIINRMLQEGYYLNLGIFPGVPIKNTGVRFTITRLHTFEQIENMVAAMAHHYPLAMEEEGYTMDKVYRAFKMTPPEEASINKAVTSLFNQSDLKVQHETSITAIDRRAWNQLLGDRGSFDWEGLKFLEDSFKDNKLPQDNWKFDYLIIKDSSGKPVLATFLTTALTKDDMLSPEEVSRQIEEKRKDDPLYLTSKTLMMGSLLTDGNHLYINKKHRLWKDAMDLLFEKISTLQDICRATVVNLRDLNPNDPEMDSLLIDNGYFKVSMPENHVIDGLDWNNAEELIKTLSKRSKKHFKQDVLKHADKYEIRVRTNPAKKDIELWYQLYLNVKDRSLALNTFTIPYKVFENMTQNKNWDIQTLTLKAEYTDGKILPPVAVMFSYLTNSTYNFMLVGVDYTFNKAFSCYRQSIYRVLTRAKQLSFTKVRLGFSATVEKRKFGAVVSCPVAYIQTKDNYNMEVLGTLNAAEHA